jgi:hypothetical protein
MQVGAKTEEIEARNEVKKHKLIFNFVGTQSIPAELNSIQHPETLIPSEFKNSGRTQSIANFSVFNSDGTQSIPAESVPSFFLIGFFCVLWRNFGFFDI